jgi:hypothetical protein
MVFEFEDSCDVFFRFHFLRPSPNESQMTNEVVCRMQMQNEADKTMGLTIPMTKRRAMKVNFKSFHSMSNVIK